MSKADEERVWSLHCRGLAPSQIDERMRLDPGTAAGIIAAMWAEDRHRVKEEGR